MSSPPSTADDRTVVVRAPTRLDFGGGWTDVPPYSSTVGGYVCNVAITRYATVRLTRRITTELGDASDAGRELASPGTGDASTLTSPVTSPLASAALRRWEVRDASVEVTSDFPVGAGLGGSSAVGVALAGALAAWRGECPDRRTLAERSRAVEAEECGIAGGRQDHYAAAFGGALGLRFLPGDGVEVRRLPLDERTRRTLETRCVLAYTGEARVSATTITAVLDAVRDRDARVTDALARMAALAEQMADALAAGDVDGLGTLVGEQWTHQRSLHPAIPTPTIDRLLDAARRAGALGGKALGASGGGCVLAIAPPGRVDAVREALADGAQILRFQIDDEGVTVVG
ncbi:MAG TPA: hypothetical protein VFX39_06655 [Gemmatimonadaceae bacterium]|nr:hypothetical protein [Gemmatimonadaceae bacterium]